MSSPLMHMMSGRKRESFVWSYFQFDENSKKSKCIALDNKGEECGFLLAGKNTSNLKIHLKAKHKSAYDMVEDYDEKQKLKKEKSGSQEQRHKPQQRDIKSCFVNTTRYWSGDEHTKRVNVIKKMIIGTGCPVTYVDNPSFKEMINFFDPRFKIPVSGTFVRLMKVTWANAKQLLQKTLSKSRRITICLDAWTKKGLSSSFLGISACFFDPCSNKARHITLQLAPLHHPHSGEQLARVLESCLKDWDIDPQKILMIISDNGSNMIKAVTIIKELHEQSNQSDEKTETDDDDDDDSEIETELSLPESPKTNYVRMPCMSHSLQLIIKKGYNHYNNVINKARQIVVKIRKSSKATQMLISKCGKTAIADNATRWNSTYKMLKRLLEIKIPLNEVLAIVGVDSFLVDEWTKINDIINLLQPFATQTDILQTDSTSLSAVVPSLLDIDFHLQQQNGDEVRMLRTEVHKRFAPLLYPYVVDFNPLPAAACLVDPNLAAVFFTPEGQPMLQPAKTYLIQQMMIYSQFREGGNEVQIVLPQTTKADDNHAPPAKRFKFVADKILNQNKEADTGNSSVEYQLNRYMDDVKQLKFDSIPDIFAYWTSRESQYDLLAPVALDILSAPASQAYVERIFSVCEMLTGGKKNKMEKTLATRICLKLNKATLETLDFFN